ncbi:TPA: PilI type IV pilus biogenesis protein, partial [Escherichia coli]|nr:PilI type IV pilus biogenesis protein [Escherichia coli]
PGSSCEWKDVTLAPKSRNSYSLTACFLSLRKGG